MKSIPVKRTVPVPREQIAEEEEEEEIEAEEPSTPEDDIEDEEEVTTTVAPVTLPKTKSIPDTKTDEPNVPAESDVLEQEPTDNGSFSFIDVQDRWRDIIREATKINASLTLALTNAHPKSVDGHKITIAVRFPFHKERLADATNALTLNQAFDTILSAKTRVSVVVDPHAGKPAIFQALDVLGGEVV